MRERLLPPLADLLNVVVTEPLDYGPFSSLIAAAIVVLADLEGFKRRRRVSGKPVLVMRETTERLEAVYAGTVALIGTDERCVYESASRLLSDPDAYRMAQAVNPYGDGWAARRAVAAIEAMLGTGQRLPTSIWSA